MVPVRKESMIMIYISINKEILTTFLVLKFPQHMFVIKTWL